MNPADLNKTDISTKNPKFFFVGGKPGMDNVDEDKINKIILEASKNTHYYKKFMERKSQTDAKVNAIKTKIRNFMKDKQAIINTQKLIESKIQSYEKERNLDEIWSAFDLDMFYVACEIRDDPSLKNKPVSVGSMTYTHTANYIARQYGIRCNMPGFIAKKLCPDLIIIRGNYEKYHKTSEKFKNILREYVPSLELKGKEDEAVINMSDILLKNNIKKLEDIQKFCNDIRLKINESTGITTSSGIASNMMLAKICSDYNKPDGIYILPPVKEKIIDFMSKLPIRKIPGIGVVLEDVLKELGIKTCQEILEQSLKIYIGFSSNMFEFLIKSALGLQSKRFDQSNDDRKSLRVGHTFMVEDYTRCKIMDDVSQMYDEINEISKELTEDMLSKHLLTKQITISLKTFEFDIVTKIMNLDKYINDVESIKNAGISLLNSLLPVKPLRQIVLTATKLKKEDVLKTGMERFLNVKKADPIKDNDILDERNKKLAQTEIINKEYSENKLETFQETQINNKQKEDSISIENTCSSNIFEKNSNKLNDSSHSMENTQNSIINMKIDNINENSIILKPNDEVSSIFCPICNMKFDGTINNSRINNHIDKCLASSTNNKKDRENDSAKNSIIKRKVNTEKDEPQLKKMKKTNQTTTITQFFHKKQQFQK